MESSILVVDRDRSYQTLIARLLTWGGFTRVRCVAEDGLMQALAYDPPSLIVLGFYRREQQRSWHALRQIRAHPETWDTPVIVCLTDTSLWEQIQSSEAGHHCTPLHKPFQIDSFLTLIREQISFARSHSLV
jgi:DNA-binding response OmpR family regulator